MFVLLQSSVPDLETVPFRVLKREEEYEIREVEVIVISYHPSMMNYACIEMEPPAFSNTVVCCELCVSVQSYFIAETMMPGTSGFDFSGSSQSFNSLASYLFGKVFIVFPLWTRNPFPVG
jgi:hypothetical protein